VECLAASVSYAISYTCMDRYLARRGMDRYLARREIGPVVLSACQLLIASVMLAIAVAVTGVPTPHVIAESVAAVTVPGVIGTGFA
jgi:drug/metabolite transporter (DMT)-like permease